MQLTQHVWYVAYGSNLCESRFLAYINGSDGTIWPRARGCRDKTSPSRDISGEIPGSIYFAERSISWDNGGVAFYDPTLKDSITLVRMYLVTLDQFNDIFLQENGLDAGDITATITNLSVGSSVVHGTGWYCEIWRLADVNCFPAFTFTSPVRKHQAVQVAPSRKYVEVIAEGLRSAHGKSENEALDYLRLESL